MVLRQSQCCLGSGTIVNKTESGVEIIPAEAVTKSESAASLLLPTDEEKDEFVSTSLFINSQCVVHQPTIKQPCMYQATTTIINRSVSTGTVAKKATFPWLQVLCIQVLAAHTIKLYAGPLYEVIAAVTTTEWVEKFLVSFLSLFWCPYLKSLSGWPTHNG